MSQDNSGPTEEAWLVALSALVIPPEVGAGEGADGVEDYLRKLLFRPRGQLLGLLVAQLRSALGETGAGDFPNRPTVEREQILRQLIEQADAPLRRAWSMFIEFCVEAWLCDPARGGNRQGQGWQRVGMSGPGRAP
ncbi:MAG: gluconate 2-dehydrogenase subunit 3 family protein [Wenzhouxiangella sp.]|nr:gluconate 2-dehydrogenase subunit 3 family protein [Wenzhouxiangella sp.]MCH8478281.1 gluconate 2-dehydrogenase subunit 3 family protein [Wenzhouxiangella sp.]TVR97578.1 MAG: hypothetical protein EA418_02945 [Wenzhouxiangellaceae bacterium]